MSDFCVTYIGTPYTNSNGQVQGCHHVHYCKDDNEISQAVQLATSNPSNSNINIWHLKMVIPYGFSVATMEAGDLQEVDFD
jgi:hypothetical protein